MTDDQAKPDEEASFDPPSSEEPIDAEFREAPRPEKVKRGPGWFSSFVMMLLAAAGGGALGYAGAERLPGLLGGEAPEIPADIVTGPELETLSRNQAAQLGETTDALDALAERLSRAEGGLEALQAAPAENLNEQVGALTARLDAIETLPAGEGMVASDAVSRSLASAIARVDRLEARLAEREEVTGAEFSELRRSLANLSTEIATSQAVRLGEGNTLAEAALALSTIDAAARRGQDFAAAFAVLQRARPDSPAVADIAPIAASGAPTLAMLKSDFETSADRIEDLLEAKGDTGAAGAAGRLFGDLVNVRSPEAAADFAALDEARAALSRDDLGGAISAMSRLDGVEGEIATDWIARADARRTLERALDTLRLDLMVDGQTPVGTQ